MNVLYLTLNPNRASTTVPTENWFRLLAHRGLNPVLVSRESGNFQRWARERGVPCYDVPLPFPRLSAPREFASSLLKISRIIRSHRIELVHSNEQDVYPIAQYAARLAGLPKVVSVHFTMDRGYCEWAFGGRRAPERLFYVSEGNLEACRPAMNGIVPRDRWRVLPNGIDLTSFRPDSARRDRLRRALGIGDATKTIGVACALRPRKQLEHLFDVASTLSGDVAVLVAGGPVAGDEAYAEQLLATGRERLGQRLKILGHLDELRDFYNALDLFINTSQEEACSISVIEALACGCPVVGYPSRSVDGQILPAGGEIVPQDDRVALGAAISRWLAVLADSSAARAGARSQAERLFDADVLASALWAEYQALLGAAR